MIQTFIITIDTDDAFTAGEIEEYLGIQLDNHVDQSWNSFKVVKKMAKGNIGNALYAITNSESMRAEREAHPKYNDVFKTDNGEITVDTCWVADCGWYETGINVHDNWYIVQKNIDKSELKAVHDKWVTVMKKEPFKKLRDMWAEDGDLDD